MKKFFSLTVFVMMAVLCHSFVSCEKDDNLSSEEKNYEIDYTLEASGYIVVSDNSGKQLYTCNVMNAGYRLWSTDINMSDATLSFKAFLSPEGGYTTHDERLGAIYLDVFHPKIELGKISEIGDLSFGYKVVDSHGYIEIKSKKNYFVGEVSIVNIEINRYISLRFSNCKTEISPYVVFDGEIKFPVRKVL